MNATYELTLGIIATCILLTGSLIIATTVVKMESVIYVYIRRMLYFHIINLCAVLLTYATDGKQKYIIIAYISSCISYVSVLCIIWTLHRLISMGIPERLRNHKILTYLPAVWFVLLAIMYITTYWTSIFLSISGDRLTYQRHFLLSQSYIIIALIDSALGIYYSIKKKDKISRVFAGFIFVVFAFYPLQRLTGNSSPLNLGLTTALSLLYIFVVYKGTIEANKNIAEVAELRSKIMVSQIQPHFIFNSLSSIILLCKKEPDRAAGVLEDFSDYLRMNIDTLSFEGDIPFEKELDHIDTYIKLEKVRFEERIDIEYDIDTAEFMIPPLLIQPLVENAVKHGILKRPEGGKISLRSYESDGEVHIVVEDNGMGFSDDSSPDDTRVHVGLENVRKRLKDIGGELQLSSVYNMGTRCEVIFPLRQ